MRLWHWEAGLVPVYEKEGQEYTAKFPNVKVAVEQTDSGEYPQKVTASVAGGVPPDVIGVTVLRADFLTFASNGQLTPLLPYIQRDKFDIDDFAKPIVKQHTWKGTLYSIPYAWNTVGTYFNADIFKKEGLKTPLEYWREGKWTWDTYLELAGKLTKGSGTDKQWGSGVIAPSFTWAFFPHIWSNGGNLFDADYTHPTITEPAAMAAFQFAFDVKKFAPRAEDSATGTVASGRIAIWPEGDLLFGRYRDQLKFNYLLVPPPASPKTGKVVFQGNSPGFGIPKGAKYPDESWALEKFILSPESLTRAFPGSGNPPPRLSLSNSKELWKQNTKLPDPDLAWEMAKLKEANSRNQPKISTWAQMTTALTQETSLAWADKQPLEETVKKISDQWAKLLKEGDVDKDVE